MTLNITLKVLVIGLISHDAISFIIPGHVHGHMRSIIIASGPKAHPLLVKSSTSKAEPEIQQCTWSPQDLTKDNPGFPPIPDDDYIKQYQNNPHRLWPVEFFVIAHRKMKNETTRRFETQVLVRESANGTSKYGLGTGVPSTRWVPSSRANPPTGYAFSEPTIAFDARNYPEFRNDDEGSWTYRKIDVRGDAFRGSAELRDPELENYAIKIRDELGAFLSNRIQDGDGLSSWESSTISVLKNVVDDPTSVAAIQGALRMSGLFAKTEKETINKCDRYVNFEDAPDPAKLVESMRIYTMFPQMPDPMQLPSTSAEELRKEIATREIRMAESGRDPHKDKYGRMHTHKSTSNVSNTIHGVYFTLDATHLPGLDEVPALDLFSVKETKREWVSLIDLKVLAEDGKTMSTVDTKPTFISGFIVRELVKEGVIEM